MAAADKGATISSLTAAPEGTEATTPAETETPKRKRAVSRRSRSARGFEVLRDVPPRGLPTDAEKQMLQNLKELQNSTGGLKNEDVVLTVAMVMQEEARPLIHEGLLSILLKTTPELIQQLMKTHAFLPAVHNWLNLYAKTEQESWSGVLIQVLELFGRLPLTKEQSRDERIKVKKLMQSGATEEIRRAALRLFEHWDEKKTKLRSVVQGQKTAAKALSRLNSWPKRKVGKAYIAVDPHVKSRNPKLSRRQSGPVTSSYSSFGSSNPSSPKMGLQKMFSADYLPPAATEAVNKLIMEQDVKEFAAEGPSQLVHSMETPPSSPVFYAHQRALFAELKSEKERQSLTPWEESGATTQSATSWTEPASTQFPVRDVDQAPLKSPEKDFQETREKAVPATNSGVLFSSTLESTTVAMAPPVLSIPFFPRNEGQYHQQRQILQEVGLKLPALLGPPHPERP